MLLKTHFFIMCYLCMEYPTHAEMSNTYAALFHTLILNYPKPLQVL